MAMNYTKIMELLLIGVVTFLCGILFFNLFRKIRSVLPWRVNCWFCNTNSWLKFPERNCWTCPSCEQYNGFNKDGDYNKSILFNTSDLSKTQRVSKSTPPRNGLCKMCNINQQLKVTQLANYVPMNDNNFDEEIESYRLQLERAYKLCSPCKINVQMKLHKEKEVLLGSKVLQARTPEKKQAKQPKVNEPLKKVLNFLTAAIAVVILALLSVECYKAIMNDKQLSLFAMNMKEIASSLLERAVTSAKAKLLLTFPFLETYTNDVMKFVDNSDYLKDFLAKYDNLEIESFDKLNQTIQGALGGVACLLQILGHVLNINSLKYAFVLDVMWAAFVVACVAQPYAAFTPINLGFIKITCVLIVLTVQRIMSRKVVRGSVKMQTPPKRIKHLSKTTKSPQIEDSSSMDTDDDVSLTQFGLHNFTDSSTEPHANSFNSGRVFSPRVLESSWKRPAMNSTFDTSFTSRVSKSPSCVSETVFAKPSFDKYQELTRDDSDSDLDESISGLCIGSPKKAKHKTNSMFSLRKFTATPSFVTPTVAPVLRKPLISPSKLGHGTSWVAGGYWGSEGERQLFNIDGSRSSSQSSGFESQASSLNQKTVFSQPPSREESVCSDADRTVLDRFQNCSVNSGLTQRVCSPVFPQMLYNNHVQIPQFSSHMQTQQMQFKQMQTPQMQYNSYVQTPQMQFNIHVQTPQYGHTPFKAPGGLFKLPQIFPSR